MAWLGIQFFLKISLLIALHGYKPAIVEQCSTQFVVDFVYFQRVKCTNTSKQTSRPQKPTFQHSFFCDTSSYQ